MELPTKLLKDVGELCAQRGLELDDVVRLYLRSLITVSKSARALGLDDPMPFGKYRDERLEVIIRSDPRYIKWMIDQAGERFKMTPEALLLLEMISKEGEDK